LSFLLIPPLLPYVISGVHAWRNMTEDRLRVALFLLVLVAGTVGVCSALFGAFGLNPSRSDLLWMFGVQALANFLSAEFLVNGE
jgi:hypothetical protein